MILKLKGPSVAIIYLLALWLSYLVRVIGQLPPIIWLANGVGAAVFILCGLRYWPWIFAAEFIFRLIRDAPDSQYPLISCAISSAGVTFGEWLGAYLFLRKIPFPTMTAVREIILFVFYFLIVGLSIATGIQMFGLWLANIQPLYSTSFALKAWWIDGAIGTVVLGGGSILLWKDTQFNLARYKKLDWQLISALALSVAVGLLSYTPLAKYNDSVLFRQYLFFPIIMWASLRWNLLGALLVSVITVVCSTIGVLYHYVPNSIFEQPQDQILVYELFVLIVTVSGFTFAAAIREREEASRAKDQFLANMSHEIRTPLGIVIGYADLIASEALPQEEKTTYMKIVKKNGSLLKRVIDDVLDLSSVEAKKLSIENSEFALVELVDEAIQGLSLKAKEKKLDLKMKIQINKKQKVFSDPIRILQIVDNMVGNALKFTDKGEVEVVLKEDSSTFFLQVKDTGLGIAKMEQNRLFLPFSQIDSANNRRFGGTGLGLYLSEKLHKVSAEICISWRARLGKVPFLSFA